MHRLIFGVILSASAVSVPGRARGQDVIGGIPLPRAYAAPGYYGMSYGSASFGVPRTYSAFSSPYGQGYGYGYAPSSFLPGRFGIQLWRPGFVAPGYTFGASSYRTFPVPYIPGSVAPSPPVGVYAPGFGPSADYGF